MYAFFHQFLCDKKGEIIFSCFGIWHLCYLILILAIGLLFFFRLKKKPETVRDKRIAGLIHIAFGLYIADFFFMPLAYGEIDIEKLPFHICTAMCVMCFLSNHNAFLKKYRVHFALLGFISNLIYLFYPAGVMWYQIHPLSYRVIQTLLFHGFMSLYGFFSLFFGSQKLEWKTCYRDFLILIFMTLWALLGNTLYNGHAENYSHHFNWFFVTQDPFYVLPPAIAPYIMPFFNIIAFFSVDMLIYALSGTVRKRFANNGK